MDTLLNLPSKDGNYPLMQAVTNNRLVCAVRLPAAGARIMVPVNHFEDHTAAPTSMLHEISTRRLILKMVVMMQEVDLFLLLCFRISLRIPRSSTAGLNKWASSCSEPSLVKMLLGHE